MQRIMAVGTAQQQTNREPHSQQTTIADLAASVVITTSNSAGSIEPTQAVNRSNSGYLPWLA
jgi:hypothetical protein